MHQCPDTIKRLIDRFTDQADRLLQPDYNETLLRIDFINPLMTELGWDIDNRQGFAEQYREVVHEDRVKVSGQTKAPDYSFRVGGHRKFFLEAKKPSVDIRNGWEPAYQLRRYAWSAKLACSLLTDFEGLAIYDTRIRPKQLEKASTARREFIPYTDYPKRWEFLSGTFSKDAVLRGEFDRYCESKKGRGAQLFDDAFLEEIEEWRKSLATSLARCNESLDEASLNFAVQRIIDRIIFLRIAEDRGTEAVGQLQGLINGKAVYERLCTLFRSADDRYNSGLFHFQKERDREEAPDTLTPTLAVEDKTLKSIIEALYYPQSPYEFTVVSADILGSVYERFLGKVITLTATHRAKIEEKPEVRKAGGVYYTPTYIVDYIVNNTVGKLLEGVGFGGGGSSKGETGGAQDVSGTGRVGSRDAAGGEGLRTDQAPPGGGEVRPDQSTPSSGDLGTGKHRRRIREGTSRRLPTSSLDREGFAGGGGDASDAMRPAENDRSRNDDANLGPDAIGRETPGSAAPLAAKPQTPNPKPRLKVLDPACGSGSFLIGAYQHLLNWYLEQYTAADPANLATGKKPVLRPGADGGWALTIAERKRILLDHIHGVDLDAAAVEVTKLNLLLKCLEGETSQTLGFEERLFRDRALPDLGRNIKCGNSLIGTDIIGTEAWNKMTDDERRRINPFDYERAFPQVFQTRTKQSRARKEADDGKRPSVAGARDPGFDAVIGNPPYIRMEEFKPLKTYLANAYACHDERSDLYAYVMERSHRLLRIGGIFGMIVSNKFVRANYGKPLRASLPKLARPIDIVDFAGLPVFVGATVRTLIYIAQRSPTDSPTRYTPPAPRERFPAITAKTLSVQADVADRGYELERRWYKQSNWSFARPHMIALMRRLGAHPTLNTYVEGKICMGVKSGLSDAFIISRETRDAILSSNRNAEEIIRPLLNGREIRRYCIEWQNQFLLYMRHGVDIARFPAVERHLRSFKAALEKRATRQEWYELQQPQERYSEWLDGPKIIFPDIATQPRFALDEDGFYGTNTVYFIPRTDRALLGMLNSKVGYVYFQQVCAGLEGGGDVYLRFFGQYLEGFPIPEGIQQASQDLTFLVSTMLTLHKTLAAEKNPNRRESIQREIDATDRQIDQLVYQLYGLTDEEIQIVEEATS